MDRDLEFVKEQIVNQERMAAKFADQPHRCGLHLSSAQRFRSLAERLERLVTSSKSQHNNRVNICLSDLEGLPDELMAELGISDADKQEMVIEDIISNNNGIISLDKLLVYYYKRENQIVKRGTFVSKLYRMGEKGMIFNVPGKRGYYSTQEMTSEEVRKVFGEPDKNAEESAGTQQVNESASEPPSPDQPSINKIRIRRRPLIGGGLGFS